MKIEIRDTSNDGSIEIDSPGPSRIDLNSPGLFPTLREIRISGTRSVLPNVRTATITTSSAVPVTGELRIEIAATGLDPKLVTIVERGLPGPRGPSGAGGGNSYFPQGWS